MNRIFYLAIILLFGSVQIFAIEGPELKYRLDLRSDICIFSLTEAEVTDGQEVDFYFPPYSYTGTAVSRAFVPGKEGFVCEIRLERGHLLQAERLSFDMDVYVEQVDSLHIELRQGGLLMGRKELAVSGNFSYLPTLRVSFDTRKMEFDPESDVYTLSIYPLGDSHSRFILGRLEGKIPVRYTYEDMGISQIMDSIDTLSMLTKEPGDVLFELPCFETMFKGYGFRMDLNFSPDFKTRDSILYLSHYIEELLRDYSLYTDNDHKATILSEHSRLVENSSVLPDYYHGLDVLLKSLKNCHFRLNLPADSGSENQPLLFYEYQGGPRVAAILDTTLFARVKLGDRLLSINNIPVADLKPVFIDQLYVTTEHQGSYRAAQRLVKLAERHFGTDSLVMQMKGTDGREYELMLRKENLNAKMVLPPDFNRLPYFYKEVRDGVLYIRVMFSEKYLMPFIYSNMDEIRSSKGLIIDFRGVNGGDMSFCNLTSLFVDRLTPIIQVAEMDVQKEGTGSPYSSLIVKPSADYYYDKPVVFLVNPITTCASELMISALKKQRQDVFIIGSENSTGSAQLAQYISLPQGAMLTYFQGQTRDIGNRVLDHTGGLMPDVHVVIREYSDLAPYNDKVKQTAFKFLNEYTCYGKSGK